MTKKEYEKIIGYLRDLIAGTKFEGKVYSVGGCERDKRLKNEIKDLDLVIEMKDGGSKFAKWLEKKGETVGDVVEYRQFGTAMFKLKLFPDEEIECVQTRKEKYRIDSRKPETCFGTVYDDCRRRDFTVNAFYHDISLGKDIDMTGNGEYDLKHKVIRTCDEPEKTFDDDPLRIMRGIRFACRLGFKIEPKTLEGMKNGAAGLGKVSNERIMDEFCQILSGPQMYNGFDLLCSVGVMNQVFPEIAEHQGMIRHCLSNGQCGDFGIRDRKQKVVCFLALAGKVIDDNKKLEERLKELKFDNNTIKETLFLVDELGTVLKDGWNDNPKLVRKTEYECGTKERFKALMYVMMCCRRHHTVAWHDGYTDRRTGEWKKGEMWGYKLPVNGHDVMNELGIGTGKQVREELDRLLDMAFEHPDITYEECIDLLHGLDSVHFPMCVKVVKKCFGWTDKLFKEKKK